MNKERSILKNVEVRKMPSVVMEAIRSVNAEREEFLRLQNQRLEELKKKSASSSEDRDSAIRSLQEAGILDEKKKLAKEYK